MKVEDLQQTCIEQGGMGLGDRGGAGDGDNPRQL